MNAYLLNKITYYIPEWLKSIVLKEQKGSLQSASPSLDLLDFKALLVEHAAVPTWIIIYI